MAFIGRVAGYYRTHFRDPRRERLFISSLSFFAGFAAARAITHRIRSGRTTHLRNMSVGGRHLHHLVFGVGGLLGVGYFWLTGIGTPESSRGSSRTTAAPYGVASALTLDEFALWLNLQDVYWARQGRESIDAVVLFGSLLSIGVWGRPFFRAVARDLLGLERTKARPVERVHA